MIQRYLADELRNRFSGLEWTYDYYTASDHTGTVLFEGGGAPDSYESGMRYPVYMVYIRSSNWAYAETVARLTIDELHRDKFFQVTVDNVDENGTVISTDTYEVYRVNAATEANRLGVTDDVMAYSINFDVALRKL